MQVDLAESDPFLEGPVKIIAMKTGLKLKWSCLTFKISSQCPNFTRLDSSGYILAGARP